MKVHKIFLATYKTLCFLIAVLVLLPSSVYALDDREQKAIDTNTQWFVPDESQFADMFAEPFGREDGSGHEYGQDVEVGCNNAQTIWTFLTTQPRGLSNEQAAGLMGNLEVESGFRPDNQQDDVAWPGGGWGIAQWTNEAGAAPGQGRRDLIRDEALAVGVPYYNETEPNYNPDQTRLQDLLAFQLNYMYLESTQRPSVTESAAFNEWTGMQMQVTVEDAVEYWLNNYERAQSRDPTDRIEAANGILDTFMGGGDPCAE